MPTTWQATSVMSAVPAYFFDWMKIIRTTPIYRLLLSDWLFFMSFIAIGAYKRSNPSDVRPLFTKSLSSFLGVSRIIELEENVTPLFTLRARWNRRSQLCITSCCDKQVMNVKNTNFNNGRNVVQVDQLYKW